MEKLTYGENSPIDLIFQNIQKPETAKDADNGQLISRSEPRFRTYTGVAGIIRRRMVISISVAIFSGSFSILLGFLLYARQLVNLAEAITLIGMLFIMGLILNGWLILRLMRNPLKNIEHVEDTLVDMAESGTYKMPTPQLVDIQSTPFKILDVKFR